MIGGATAWLTVCCVSPHRADVVLGGLGVAVLAALAPDIDHERSLARAALPPVTWILSWALRVPFGGQRRITHCLLGSGVLFLALAWCSARWAWPSWIVPAAVAGWCSHIILDCCTEQGCPLLWPSMKRYGLPRELAPTTGGRRGRNGKRHKITYERALWQPALALAGVAAGALVVMHGVGP
jgi:membrane-bound metal-dependent hydrolase YbcI (DUF457 family)